jgi:hypothetical protein
MKHLLFLGFLSLSLPVFADDLVLLRDAASDYQIVVPDQSPTPGLAECLKQTARLIQAAFKANSADVSIVNESKRDAAKPALYLGDTKFAQKQGVDVSTLHDWSYVHRAVGRDIIITGRDESAKAPSSSSRRPNWDRAGTTKAAVDFARQFMGVRFLYPDIPSYTAVSGAAKIDLLASPAIEFLPMKTMSVPADLNVTKVPVLRLNSAHPAYGGFYDLANNRFPRVDTIFGSHTWPRAVPAEKYWKTHPEYFALINGVRLNPEGGKGQYCLSNPEVQELIYQDVASMMDQGYASVDLGQPDGFRECQCANCEALYGTGKDWSEKIWIFHRKVAERLQQTHPGKEVTMMSYILTAKPPKTFKAFPPNTGIMLTGTNEEDIAPWREIEVPRGFTGYLYNWCPNLGTRYTPMRTPGFIETQVKRLAANRIQALHRDGAGQLWGLEGPVYYVMGRMFDDPEHNSAKELLPEFCEAAFGKGASVAMRSFYDQLYNAIALYSDHIGTRCDVWTFQPLPGEGRPRKTVQDPFQLIAFLYTPNVIAALDADLTQAEKAAPSEKVKTRLALVRKEFDWVRHLARVVHLYQAYQIQPDSGSRDRLLDAIDARNAYIASLFDKKGRPLPDGNWSHILFPPGGHSAEHLRLAYDGYQEPYANTCLNWDTKAMRSAPLPGKKRLAVARIKTPVTIDMSQWQQAEAHELTVVPPFNKRPLKTTMRLLHDDTNLYLRAECELEAGDPVEYPKWNLDRVLSQQEAIDLYFDPQPGRDVFYRLAVGANAASRYDAAAGFISDVMDPRHGKDDPAWNGDWKAESRIDAKTHVWQTLVTIPFKTLGMASPVAGATWRANFGRNHRLPREKVDRAIWSSTLGSNSMDDRSIFGELVFE